MSFTPAKKVSFPDAPNNLSFTWELGDQAAADQALAGAHHVTTYEFVNQRLVPNAIDVASLPPPRQREELCDEIGADPARPLVGTVGRLSFQQGGQWVALHVWNVAR